MNNIDIAPEFRQLLAISPLKILQMMKSNLTESGNSSPMIIAILNDIEEELQSRTNEQKLEDALDQ